MVIDQGVHVVEADLGRSVAAGGACGATVHPPTATVGDTPELLDVHVHQLAGTVAFVTDRGLPGRMSSPLIRSSWASRGMPSRASTRETVRAGTPVAAAIPSGPQRSRRRAATTSATVSDDVRVGLTCGREDRSTRPAAPSAAKRATHVRTHLREIPIAAAMCASGHPAAARSTINNRPIGVVRA
jgi:hypothetical protein